MLRLMLILFVLSLSLHARSQKCEISINGLRNSLGNVKLIVFASKEGFPNKHEKAYAKKEISITGSEVHTTIEMKPGKYAIVFIHDENMNKKMDRSWVGMPKEGYGVSNNPKLYFKPPSFKQCVIEVTDKGCKIDMNIKYF